MDKKIKLVVVTGPTASGKTGLSIELAKRFQGEIISADSMQIYKQMNIATAKPTVEEMKGIPHYLMDFLSPEQSFSVSEFVTLAREKIRDIASRGKLPMVVGGTGLYINSLIDHISFEETQHNEAYRQRLYEEAQKDGGESLYKRLCEIDPESAAEIHPNNLVRVIRAVEIFDTTGLTMTQHKKQSRMQPSPYDLCMIGLNFADRQKLYERINLRVDQMMENGLLKEAEEILKRDDLKTAWNAIGYKELKPYFDGQSSLEECVEKIKQESRRYAKRQLTWFRRDKRIQWLYPDEYDSFQCVIEKSQKIIESFINL